jgi:predicted permease
MSLWTRIINVIRADRLSREIDEELESHIAEALEEGRDPAEVRSAFGSAARWQGDSRDIRMIPWLDSVRADAVFGWRQILKRKVTSAAAVLSLVLAIGSCTSAFRLMDAIMLRPLPVTGADRLYALSRQMVGPDGQIVTGDSCAYPMFRQMREQVKGQAELIAISSATQVDVTYGSDQEMEKANQQYVSGWMFGSFGLRPALGRVFSEEDDRTPGAHPFAVLSYDYWTRRFGRDPRVLGRKVRSGGGLYEIVGVAQGPFTGTEPGEMTDIFLPTMMMSNRAIERSDYRWFRTYVQLKPGVVLDPVREKLRASFAAFLQESVKLFPGAPKQELEGYLNQKLTMEPASAGVSGLQRLYGTPLAILSVLVGLVLLIACANVASLMTAQAAARQREMALRVSIGAGRWRLVQLILVECAWLSLLASALGAMFAWWSAPMVVKMISTAGNPVRLDLSFDGRLLGFGLALALFVTILFGLGPALRASSIKPVTALKGGDNPHARSRLMHVLIGVQVAFCFLVLFVAGLLIGTSRRLTHQDVGFSTDRLLTLETLTPQPQTAALWGQVAEHLRSVPGVEAVALCEWPLMQGGSWNGFISVNGSAPGMVASYFLAVGPGWFELMKIPLLEGRDFTASKTSHPIAIVNEAFVKQYFGTGSPIGKSFEVVANEGQRVRYQIAGLVRNTRYKDMREPIQPTAFFPFNARYSRGTFMVRTLNPESLSLANTLRQEVLKARPGFRVSNVRTQASFVEQHTTRERLLAMLALFFAAMALLLASVGLYGVLDYSVIQRRREIGIRMAIGAQAADIIRRVTVEAFAMVLAGAVTGVALGIASTRYIEALLYDIKPTDPGFLALPSAILFAVALLAALPSVIRAVHVDPADALRAE